MFHMPHQIGICVSNPFFETIVYIHSLKCFVHRILLTKFLCWHLKERACPWYNSTAQNSISPSPHEVTDTPEFSVYKSLQVSEPLFWHLFSVIWHGSALIKLLYSRNSIGSNTKQSQRDNRITLVTWKVSQRQDSKQIIWNVLTVESVCDHCHVVTLVFFPLWNVSSQN